MEHCEECGFDYDLAEALAAGSAIIDGVAEVTDLLGSGRADLRTRRRSNTWSPLEYGCHLRDVPLVQRERVLAVRRVDCPMFDPMGRDERVEHDGYADQDPVRVSRQLTEAAYLYANDLSRLTPEDWERRSAMYNYPTRSERSLRWIAMHALHEVRHHLLDVRRQL
jgi:DinB family protein